MGSEALRDGAGDLVVGQIDVTAAAFAHRRGRRLGNVQISPALKTADSSLLNGLGQRRWGWAEGFLYPKMFAALLADCGVGAPGLRLDMPALWARDRDRILVW